MDPYSEARTKSLEHKMKRKMYGPEEDSVSEEQRILNNEEQCFIKFT
jgi:hypothetical protein